MKYSIQNKILICFSIIIFIGLSSLLFVSYKINEQNTERIIHNDMIGVKKNLDLYLKQYFLISNQEFNKANLSDDADTISRELSSEIGSSVDIYNSKGEKVSNFLNTDNINSDDLIMAVRGQAAYTINYCKGKVMIGFSYPIKENNKCVGIVRYIKDYSELYNNNNRFKYVINIFAIGIFIIVFIASIVISKQIAKPVIELTKSSKKVSNGDFDFIIDINSRDEVGELADTFKNMIEKIKEQISIISKERDSVKEAQSQNKLFFDNVTHELKTPLTTILGYAQMIQDNGFTDKEFFDKGISYIINESKRLNSMVVQILELSTVYQGRARYNFEKANLSELIKRTCEEMNIKGKKYNITIASHVQEIIFIEGDINKLKEVLVNLIDNSIKYGRVNSTIDVSAYREKGCICLKVKDEGVGIEESHIDNLFKPFYRISKSESREKGSAGLGLAIVKDIVQNHNGHVEINSRINEGTEVTIKFKDEEQKDYEQV